MINALMSISSINYALLALCAILYEFPTAGEALSEPLIGYGYGVSNGMSVQDAFKNLNQNDIIPANYHAGERLARGTPPTIIKDFPNVMWCKASTNFPCEFLFVNKLDGKYFFLVTFGDPTDTSDSGAKVRGFFKAKCGLRKPRRCNGVTFLEPDYEGG